MSIHLGNESGGDPRVDVLHLATLSAFAIAQPLFDLLGRKPEFFAVRRSEPIDLWLLAALLVLAAPVPWILFRVAARLLPQGPRRTVQGVCVAVLVSATVLPPLHRSFDAGPAWITGFAILLGSAAAIALDRLRPARLLLTYLTPAILVFPAVFLLRPGVAKILRAGEVTVQTRTTATTPIVVLIFDELPVISLLAGPDEIDAARFPHFAALAAESTWYRHTATVSDFTVLAVPAILSGLVPDSPRLPIPTDYPRNLFTLLGGHYAMNVSEPVTHLCPTSLCTSQSSRETLGQRLRSLLADLRLLYLHVLMPAGWTDRLPPVDQGWMLFANREDWKADWKRRAQADRIAQLERFLAGIRATDEPVLHLLHILLPHPPFEYLASGQIYSDDGRVYGDNHGILAGDDWAARHNHQRHLLQLGYTDRVLGEVIARLKATGLWDRAVVAVTSDHGVAYQAGRRRRRIDHHNFGQILAVPLWIKAPGQTQGRLDERGVATVDVLPTIADLAGVELPWPIDGVSLSDPTTPGREQVTVVPHRTTDLEPVEVSFADLRAAESAALSVLDERFPLGGGGRERFRIGPQPSWIGVPLSDLPVAAPVAYRHQLQLPAGALFVQPGGLRVPAHLRGVLVDGAPGRRLDLAVAVNGRVAGTTSTWSFEPDQWSSVVDPASFRAGSNHVELFVLERPEGSAELRLRPVPATDPPPIGGISEAGLHRVEQWRTGTIRWTDGEASVTLPIHGEPPRKLRLTIADNGPDGGRLRVIANGTRLLDTRLEPLGEEPWTTTLDLGAVAIDDRLTVAIESASFVPSERYRNSADTRRLGVAISGFELLD